MWVLGIVLTWAVVPLGLVAFYATPLAAHLERSLAAPDPPEESSDAPLGGTAPLENHDPTSNRETA